MGRGREIRISGYQKNRMKDIRVLEDQGERYQRIRELGEKRLHR
jgi:hypothetical protein